VVADGVDPAIAGPSTNATLVSGSTGDPAITRYP
jgi:hypothetical protein